MKDFTVLSMRERFGTDTFDVFLGDGAVDTDVTEEEVRERFEEYMAEAMAETTEVAT